MNIYKDCEKITAMMVYPMNNFGGLEILDIFYGIEDEVIACFNWGSGRQNIRRHKIRTNRSGRYYIRKGGRRYYFDEMMRTWCI